MSPIPPQPLRLACQKHGEQEGALWINNGQTQRPYCLFCLEEVLTRCGVHGMFPVAAPAPTPETEKWPEHLEER